MARHLLPLLLLTLCLYLSQASKHHQKESETTIENAKVLNDHLNEDKDKRIFGKDQDVEEEEDEDEDDWALDENLNKENFDGKEEDEDEEEDDWDLDENLNKENFDDEEEDEDEEEDDWADENLNKENFDDDEEEDEDEDEDDRALDENLNKEDFDDEEESWDLSMPGVTFSDFDERSKRGPCSMRKCLRWYRGFLSEPATECPDNSVCVSYCKRIKKKCCVWNRMKPSCEARGGSCTLENGCLNGILRPVGCRGRKWNCCIP